MFVNKAQTGDTADDRGSRIQDNNDRSGMCSRSYTEENRPNITTVVHQGPEALLCLSNNMRNLKFISPPTVAFFAAINHNLNICTSAINGP